MQSPNNTVDNATSRYILSPRETSNARDELHTFELSSRHQRFDPHMNSQRLTACTGPAHAQDRLSRSDKRKKVDKRPHRYLRTIFS